MRAKNTNYIEKAKATNDPCYQATKSGEYFFFADKALMYLLQKNVLVFGSIWHPDKDMNEPGAFLGIGLEVFCNDTFYWASADGEDFGWNDIEEIYWLYKDHGVNGVVAWIAKKRKLQPLPEVKKEMKQEGIWDDDLEKLPASYKP